MTTSDPHLDRARAESFGTVAQQYDRYRPPHAERLIDDLAALAPARVLDIACGTGKAAVALAGRGLDVLGVETDERMAQVARAHGVPVEIAPFETWDARGRRFGLVTCGSAWHWIDPALGAAKVADLLHPGGTFARFWSYHVLDGPFASPSTRSTAGSARRPTPMGTHLTAVSTRWPVTTRSPRSRSAATGATWC